MSTRQSGDSMFRGAGVYPRELVPAIRPGDYVELQPAEETYQVDVMTVQPGVFAFSSDNSNGVAVANNGTTSDNEATDLEQNRMWLAQYRPTQIGDDLQDDIHITMDLGGKQSPLYTNKNNRGEIVEETAAQVSDDTTGTEITADQFNDHLMELYIFEDEVPYFTFEDTGGSGGITVSDIRFAGFQYRLTEAGSVPNGAHVEPVPTERVKDM